MGGLKKIHLTFGENESTPTVLTVDMINKIVKTITDSSIETTYNGVVTCDTAIPESKAFILGRNNIKYVGNKTLDQYSIRSSKSTIIEGESFEILSNDIEISSLIFSVKQANITSGDITENELINAISISGNKITFNKLNRKTNVIGSLVIESNTIYGLDNKKTVTVLINSTHINTIVAQYDKYTFNPSIDLLNFDRVGSQTITLYPSNSSTIPLLDITASFEQNTTRYSIISKTQSSITISCLNFDEREPNAVIITAKDALGYTVGDIAVNIDNRIPTDVSITGDDSFDAVMGQGSADYLFSYNPATYNVSVELVSISATNLVSVTNKSVNGFTLSVTGKTGTISTTVTAKFKIDGKEVTVTKDVLVQYLDFIYPLVLINPTDEVIEFKLVKTGTPNSVTIRYKAVTDYEEGMYDTYDWSKVKMLKQTLTRSGTTYRVNPHSLFFISCDTIMWSTADNYWHFDIQTPGLLFDGDVFAMSGGIKQRRSCLYLFYGCKGITVAPKLPSLELSSGCYEGMFENCTSLVVAPELPATTLTDYCYSAMFRGCTSLTVAPELPATTLAQSCYLQMFKDCTSLTTAPKLPATTLTDYCYKMMFYNCTSLIDAQELLAPVLVQGCYYAMFFGCTKLNKIKMLATDRSATQCLDSWVYQVPSGGTFVKHKDTTLVGGSNGIPNGWTIVDATAYFELPSNLIAKNGNGSFEFTFHDAYKGRVTAISTNNANVVLNSLNDNKFSLNVNGIVLDTTVNVNLTIDGIVYTCSVVFTYAEAITPFIIMNTTGSAQTFAYKMGAGDSQFEVATMQGHVKGEEDYGNVQFTEVDLTTTQVNVTLQAGESFLIQSRTHVPSGSKYLNFVITTFAPEFDGDVLGTCGGKMVSRACYRMFMNCTGITKPPTLNYDTLADSCYKEMFVGCSSLIEAPTLNAKNLKNGCYDSMFKDCTKLTYVQSILPATTLETHCYNSMFRNTGITHAPELPAPILVTRSYNFMFYACNKLSYIKMLAVDISADNCLNSWTQSVSSTGTFVKHQQMTSLPTGISGIPSGWTVEDAIID